MNRQAKRLTAVASVLLVIPILACGILSGGVKQVKEVAETAKQVATAVAGTSVPGPTSVPGTPGEEPTPVAGESNAAPSGKAASGKLDNLLANVEKLAPVHATSLWASYNGKTLDEKVRVEMDIDAAGNRHIFIFQGTKLQTEIVAFGQDVFLRNGPDDQFILLQGQAGGADLGYLAVYGAPWLMLFNDVQNATKVGHETVNGFSADKYDTKFNTMGMGFLGAAAAARGGVFDYKGTAWVESQTKALVKATVDITIKESKDKTPRILQVRYDVKKAKVKPVEKPTDIFAPPTMPGS
ncbi:MAG: hypothetical protein GXP41_11290 [Chloroflexi bacterium]|nr:hypothetical protein [Chloroflexota bacterium]